MEKLKGDDKICSNHIKYSTLLNIYGFQLIDLLSLNKKLGFK